MLAQLDPQLVNDLREHSSALASGLGVAVVVFGWQKASGWWRDWTWRRAQDDPQALRDEGFDRRWGFVAEADPDAPQDLRQVLARAVYHSAVLLAVIVFALALNRSFDLRPGASLLLAGAAAALCTWALGREHREPGRDIDESHFVTPPTLSEQFPPEAVYGALASAAILGLIVLGIWLL